ncbi:MAG: hypothetical protein NXI16_04045 [Alphaproteobacteria bacterium]|nr:hypothetical protein [Alphaproteobacteria bacterium]
MTDKRILLRDIANCGNSAACHQAVTRAYSTLRDSGATDEVAFNAAKTIYSWHHPEVPKELVPYVISDWLP